MAKKNVDLIIFPTSIGDAYLKDKLITLKSEKKMWKTVIQANSLMNNVPVVVANRIGEEKSFKTKIRFWGNSFVTNQSGEIVANMGKKQEILEYPININDKKIHRKIWGFLD